MKKIKIEAGKLYEYSQLVKDDFQFARLKVNREIDNAHVTKKKESMKEMGGTIMPLLVIPALNAISQNLTVLMDDGTVVTAETKNLDKIYVILDGQHRYDALKRLLSEGETSLSCYIMLPLVTSTNIVRLLQEANTSVNPWDGIDWLTSLNVTAQGLGVSIGASEFVKELSTGADMSDSAAWLWAKGEIVSKAKIIREIKKKDKKLISEIANDKFLDQRQRLFKDTKAKLGSKLVGLKRLPKLLCEYEKELVDESIPRPDSWERVIEFVTELNTSQVKNLKEAKKTDTQTKDQVLTKLLNTAWQHFKDSHLSKPS